MNRGIPLERFLERFRSVNISRHEFYFVFCDNYYRLLTPKAPNLMKYQMVGGRDMEIHQHTSKESRIENLRVNRGIVGVKCRMDLL